MSLKKKAIAGVLWTFLDQFGAQLIGFLVSVILARLLLPEQYGLIGMITIFIGIGNVLINGGLTLSLIRTQDPTNADYSTVFFINLVGAVVIYLLLFLFAPLIAHFFRQDILVKIIRVYSVSFIINAFAEIQLTKLVKEMNFKLQMTVKLPSLVAASVVGIIMAYQGFGVWSLVWMQISQSVFLAIQLWFRTGWRPDFVFDKTRFFYHFSFGYKLLLAALLDTLYNNVYNIFIGRNYPVAQLGLYNRADSLKQLPVNNIAGALNAVTYPMFASIQNDDVKLKSVYKKIMQQVLFWVSSCVIFLGVMATPLFRFLFSEKWTSAVPYFQILCLSGILYPLHAYNLNILNVKGRSDLFFKLEIIKKAIITVGLFCALPFGIYGLLYLQVIFSVLAFFVNTAYSGRFINYPAWEQLKDIMPIVALAMAVGLLLWCINHYSAGLITSDFLRLLFAGIIYFSLFIGTAVLMKMPPVMEFKQIVLRQ